MNPSGSAPSSRPAVQLLLVGAGSAVAASRGGAADVAAGACTASQGGMGHGVMAGGVVMDAAADYIGISETALATARHDGKSLAQIAVANGKTAAGLKQALVAAFKANLDKAVARRQDHRRRRRRRRSPPSSRRCRR